MSSMSVFNWDSSSSVAVVVDPMVSTTTALIGDGLLRPSGSGSNRQPGTAVFRCSRRSDLRCTGVAVLADGATGGEVLEEGSRPPSAESMPVVKIRKASSALNSSSPSCTTYTARSTSFRHPGRHAPVRPSNRSVQHHRAQALCVRVAHASSCPPFRKEHPASGVDRDPRGSDALPRGNYGHLGVTRTEPELEYLLLVTRCWSTYSVNSSAPARSVLAHPVPASSTYSGLSEYRVPSVG